MYACRYMSYGLCCGKMGDHFLGALPLFYTSKYLEFYKQMLLAFLQCAHTIVAAVPGAKLCPRIMCTQSWRVQALRQDRL